MLVPVLRAWVEQRDDLPHFRVDAREIGAFVVIAVVARQRQIRGIITSAVLLRDDVLDMERGDQCRLL